MKDDGKIILGSASDSLPFFARIFAEFPSEKDFREFFQYLAERGITLPAKIYTNTEQDLPFFIAEELKMIIEKMDLDPLIGLGLKKDLSGKDEKTLNIILRKNKPQDQKKQEKVAVFSIREKVIATLFFVILVGACIFIYLNFKNKTF